MLTRKDWRLKLKEKYCAQSPVARYALRINEGKVIFTDDKTTAYRKFQTSAMLAINRDEKK